MPLVQLGLANASVRFNIEVKHQETYNEFVSRFFDRVKQETTVGQSDAPKVLQEAARVWNRHLGRSGGGSHSQRSKGRRRHR